MYGLGGLPEGFSRLCAIKGGVFMLARTPEELLFDDDGTIKGVVSDGEAASCQFVVGDPSYFPDEMLRETGKVVRSICFLNHPINGTGDSKSAQIIIPAKQVARAGYPARNSGNPTESRYNHREITSRYLHLLRLFRSRRLRQGHLRRHRLHHRGNPKPLGGIGPRHRHLGKYRRAIR